jgi:hypothetical protein
VGTFVGRVGSGVRVAVLLVMARATSGAFFVLVLEVVRVVGVEMLIATDSLSCCVQLRLLDVATPDFVGLLEKLGSYYMSCWSDLDFFLGLCL